jgi:hypothetical protein
MSQKISNDDIRNRTVALTACNAVPQTNATPRAQSIHTHTHTHTYIYIRHYYIKFKVKCILVQALRHFTGRTAHSGVEVKLYSFWTTELDEGECSESRPGQFKLTEKSRFPLHWRLCGKQGRSGLVRKTSPVQGFDPRTVHPIAQ